MDWVQTLPQFGAAGAIVIVVIKFLSELREMGKSRDSERGLFLAQLEKHQDTASRVTTLAQTMVDKCQSNGTIRKHDIDPCNKIGG